jgi:hypothetical protein
MPTRGRSPRRPLPLFGLPLAANFFTLTKGKARTAPCRKSRSGPVWSAFQARGLRRGRTVPPKSQDGQPRPWSSFSADAAPGDKPPADADACEIAARAEAARCEAGRRSCCKLPAARPARGASGRGRDIPESNTAPSSRADIASVASQSVTEFVEPEKTPRKPAGLCAGASSVSREIYTISRGDVSRGCRARVSRKFRARF